MSYWNDIREARNDPYFADYTEEMAMFLRNHVVEGGFVSNGGTAHADGAGVDVDLDITATKTVVDGVYGELSAVTDSAHTGPTLSAGAPDAYVAVVIKKSAADAFAFDYVNGAAAASGAAAVPTVSEIDTEVGHEDWIRIADVKFVRTGAAAVTVTLDNTVRPVFDAASHS